MEKVQKLLSDMSDSQKEEIQRVTDEVQRMKEVNLLQSSEIQKLKEINEEQNSEIKKMRGLISLHESILKELERGSKREDHVMVSACECFLIKATLWLEIFFDILKLFSCFTFQLLSTNGEGHNEQDEMDPDEV